MMAARAVRPRRRVCTRVAASVLTLSMGSLCLAACTSRSRVFPPSAYSTQTPVVAGEATTVSLGNGASVSIAPGAAPAGSTVSVTSAGPPTAWDPAATALRAPVHLSVSSGEIDGAATLSFPYDPALVPAGISPDDAFGIATYDSTSHTWVNQPATVDAAHDLIVAQVSHFSWWEPWTWDWTEIGARVSQDTLALLGKRTAPPKCTNDPLPQYIDSVVTQSDPDDPLYSCAQNDDGTLQVKVVDNRNYADILTFGTNVSSAVHDNGGNPIQYAISKLIDPHMQSNELYIPPLAGASVEIPDGQFTFARFVAAPTVGTLLADVAQIAFGGLNLAKAGNLIVKIAGACGQFLTTATLPTSEAAILGLVESVSGCLDKVVVAVAAGGELDGATASDLDKVGGTLTFLDHVTIIGTTIGVASEIGDLVLGATTDKPLRQFTLYHSVVTTPAPVAAAPPAPTAPLPAAPPTPTTAAAQPGTNLTVGSHFDDYCVIAWPTAPSYTGNSIEMTMSCQHVPEGVYLFTDVLYNDPHFQPTPETGQMHVVGTVVGVARSALGFSELEVKASHVTL